MPRKPKSEDQLYVKQNISMEPEQRERLIEYCELMKKSMSWVIRQALNQYLFKQ